MEVDEVEEQVSKFQKGSCNGGGSMNISDSSSNPNKLATQRGNYLFPIGAGVGGDCNSVGGGSLSRWPSSRIVRVSRASGGKDRHSKVVTSKGLRDRRIRLSVSTAIEFYDLQDRLGFDQPSKAVDWLIKAASSSIDELPSLDPSFFSADGQRQNLDRQHIRQRHTQLSSTDFEDQNHQTNHYKEWNNNGNSNSNNNSSSASETSKGSGLSLSRSENRIRARERARDMTTKKEKKKDTSSFTDLLSGRINNNVNPVVTESKSHWTTPMDYFQMPQFEDNNNNQPHQNQFSVLEDNFVNRGTLQSNLLSSLPHHQQLQRFQPSLMVDGSTPTNFPFSIAPDHFPTTGYDSKRLQHYGGDGGGPDHFGRKSKN